MSKPKVLITEPVPEKVLLFLKQNFEVTVGKSGQYLSEKALISDIEPFHALLSMLSNPVSEKVLKAGKNLKIVANFAVGYNNIDVKSAHNLGIVVANTPDVLTEACGDFAMALTLAVSRKFNEAENYLREGHFKGWEPLGFLGMELRSKKLGIFGMGRIGQAFAHRAKAFGMQILYTNRSKLPTNIEKELNATYVPSLEELAQQSDVLSLNCPLTPETKYAVDKKIFALMPKHSILINISRGPVVKEEDLAEALHSGSIAGAGIDVFENEPVVHPRLLSAPNCTLLPHIASATFETRDAIGMLAAQAVTKILLGENPDMISNLVSVPQ